MGRLASRTVYGLVLLLATSGCIGYKKARSPEPNAPATSGRYVLSASPDFSAPAPTFSAPPIYGKVIFAEGDTADTLWGCAKGEVAVLTVNIEIDGASVYHHRFAPTPEQCTASELEFPLVPAAGSAHDAGATSKLVEMLVKRAGKGRHEIGLRMNGGTNPNIGPFVSTTFTLDLTDTAAWDRYRAEVSQAAVAATRLPTGLNDPELVAELKAGLAKTSYEKAFDVVVTARWEVILDRRNKPLRKVMRGVVGYREPATSKCFMRRVDLYREFNGARYEPSKLVIEGGFLPQEVRCP